jgi:hypothetical protein
MHVVQVWHRVPAGQAGSDESGLFMRMQEIVPTAAKEVDGFPKKAQVQYDLGR